MSDTKKSSTITIQRAKNQITIPASIVKQIQAKEGTKYRVEVSSDGDIVLKIIKNDIRKYAGIMKTDKSAVQIIREFRDGEEKLYEEKLKRVSKL
jgi:antitoxin component of MazEF toxin-antitoxin module